MFTYCIVEKNISYFFTNLNSFIYTPQGEIDEDQFVFWVQSMPKDQVSSVLQFPILPPDGTSSSERVLPYISVS